MCNCGQADFWTIIQTVLSFAACVLAVLIPKKIAWEQTFTHLCDDYRSFDFAHAIQGVVVFFHDKCDCDTDKIELEYAKRYNKDMKELNKNELNKNKQKEDVLHYQRRLLSLFYWQLDLCANSFFIGKRRVQRNWTRPDANIIKVLYFMNRAVDENPQIFRDIETSDPLPKKNEGMNAHLASLYDLLSKSDRFAKE